MTFVQKAGRILGIERNETNLRLLGKSLAQLVPFVGAGLSAEFGYPTWAHFLRKAAEQFGISSEVDALLTEQRFEEAAEAFTVRVPKAFDDFLREQFNVEMLFRPLPKGAVRHLTRIARGIVLTTNFDRVLETAFEDGGRPFEDILGGSSIYGASRAIQLNDRILLKLHGDVKKLESRILTLTEYVSAYGGTEPGRVDLDRPLPRVLSQALASRPLFFLGCSLNGDRTTRVVAQIAEKFPGTVHFALLSESENTPDRLHELDSWNIRPLFFPNGHFEKIEELLRCIADAVSTDSCEPQASAGKKPEDRARERMPDPFQAPPLPRHFVARDAEATKLKAMLLGDVETSGTVAVGAILGLGGLGKTTLVAAVARDPEVWERFHDGIVWVTLGKKPPVLSLLRHCIQSVGGRDPNVPLVDTASANLRSELVRKKCLVVLDDAWAVEDVKPFLASEGLSRFVVTTRRAHISADLEADLYEMPLMDGDQAVGLFATRLQRPIDGAERSQVLSLAQIVGFLPIAMEQLAAAVDRGTLLTLLHDQLMAEIENLEGTNSSISRIQLRVEACFNLSLKTLAEENPEAFLGFAQLGLVKEDALIATPMCSVLWKSSPSHASEILERLLDDALLQPAPKLQLGGVAHTAYRLHDVLQPIARKQLFKLPDPPTSLPDAHQRLLALYGKSVSNRWEALADDGYIHSHLAWHMQQAGDFDKLKKLLRVETSDGRNGWYELRKRGGQTDGFTDDYMRAWQWSFRQDVESAKESEIFPCIAEQVRYALYNSSLMSLATDFPPQIITALIKHQVWTIDKASSYSRQISDADHRVDALMSVAALAEPELARVLLLLANRSLTPDIDEYPHRRGIMARMMTNLGFADEALTILETDVSGLTPLWISELTSAVADQPVLMRIFESALGETGSARASLLIALLGKELPVQKEVLDSLQDTIESWPYDAEKALWMYEMLPYIPPADKSEALDEILGYVAGAYPEAAQEVIAGIAPQLSEEQWTEAYDLADSINSSKSRAGALAALCNVLDPPRRMIELEVLVERFIPELSWDNCDSLVILARDCPEIREKVCTILFQANISSDFTRKVAFHEILPFLPDKLAARALGFIENIEEDKFRLELVSGIVESGRFRAQRSEVLKFASRATSDLARLQMMLAASQLFAGQEKRTMLTEVLAQKMGLPDSKHLDIRIQALHLMENDSDFEWDAIFAEIAKTRKQQPELLRTLARYAPPRLHEAILQLALNCPDLGERQSIVALLAPQLSVDVLHNFVTVAGQIRDGEAIRDTAETFDELPESLTPAQPDRPSLERFSNDDIESLLKKVAGPSETPVLRYEAQRVLIRCLAGRGVPGMASRLKLEDLWPNASVLEDIAPLLPESDLIEVARHARRLGNRVARTRALTAILSSLPLPERQSCLEWDFEDATSENVGRPERFGLLLPFVDPERRVAMIDTALQETNPGDFRGAECLRALAPYLTGAQIETALQLARSLRGEWDQAEALIALSWGGGTKILEEGLARASSLGKPGRAEVLGSFVNWFREEETNRRLLELALRAAKSHPAPDIYVRIMVRLKDEARWQATVQALDAVLNWYDQTGRPRSELFFLPHLLLLPASRLHEAFDFALKTFSARTRPRFLQGFTSFRFVVFALGGSSAVRETISAIKDVARWWP